MRHLFRLTLTLLFLLPCTQTGAQQLDPSYYDYPLRDVAGLYSANFGEMRSNHFHSGIDFKTDGVEGKPVVAVADGYVSRIFFSPSGYGRALYVCHPNGTTSVYAHLRSFRPDMEAWLRSEQQRLKQNRVDLYCDSTLFRVVRGEEIGRSGNSGTSFGPHLHFEIRDNNTGKTLNTMASGVYRPKDKIPPYLFRVHYVEVDTVRGVPVHSPVKSYEVEKIDKEHYRLKSKEALPVGRNGYFMLEASDRKDEVSNTFGVYRLRGYFDEECYFDYAMDGFSFEHTRYCNAVSYYPMQINSHNEILRLCCLDGNRPDFYRTLKNRGMIQVAPEAVHQIRLRADDDCGNHSEISFSICGKSDLHCFHALADTTSRIIDRRYHFRHEEDGLSVLFPAQSLYESTFYRQQRSKRPLRRDTSLVVLSPVYQLLDASIPLHKGILVAIKTFVPKELRTHVVLGSRNRKGALTCLGGSYENGAVEAKITSLGDLYVVADTVAPQIRPSFQSGDDLRGRRSVKIRLTDNFSGIRHWAAYIDKKWVPLDYQPLRATATLPLDKSLASGEHHLLLIATDPTGNTARWEGNFRR